MTQTLITCLSKLDAPDREVDAEICVLFQYGGGNSEGATNVRTDPDWDGDLLFEIGNEACCNPIPKLTASVDAAIALAEKMLPGWKWYAGNWNVHAAVLSPDRNSDQRAVAATPAIALCIAVLKGHAAILRAKEANHAE